MKEKDQQAGSYALWVAGRYGKKGEQWLSELPEMLQKISAQWGLKKLQPLNNSQYNYTAFCESSAGEKLFIKLSYAVSDVVRESKAISLLSAPVLQYLRVDAAKGALLLPRLNPALPLHSLNDEDRQNMAAALLISKMKTVAEADYEFPQLSDWFSVIDRELTNPSGMIGERYLQNCRDIFAELERAKKADVLLHGDLHHYNILLDKEDWKVIDPKGVIGNPLYETACFMYNPSPQFYSYLGQKNIISRRIAIFSEILGYFRDQIAAMAYCQSVLSACWCVEDRQDCWKNALYAADLIYQFV